ncbi:MAG: AsmA family protein [Spartobacteria bacterium]
MRKFSRLLLFALAAVVAFALVALIGANLYVQSQATQARIQQELSHRLGTTLQIRRISVTPWGGLKLTGITIPQTMTGQSSDFLVAETFGLRVRLLSLFSKRLVIKEIKLVSPTVYWAQNANGKWRLPGRGDQQPPAEAQQEQTLSPAISESPPVPDVTSSATPRSVPAPKIERPTSGRAFEPEVRHFSIARGNFRFLDQSQAAIAAFENVDVRCRVSPTQALRGDATIEKVSLRDRFFLEQLRTPLRFDTDELDLPNISAKAAGGEVNGRFLMHPESADSPFHLNIRFHDLQADQIVKEAGGPSGTVQGRLEGKFEAQGETADPNALNGAGEILLRDGQLRQYSLLVALGQILQIEELTQLHLQEAEAKYHVTPGVVTIDELILRSANIRLSATGTVAFNGKLRLQAQLAISEKIRGQLYKPIRQNFQPLSDTDLSAVDFEVTGTVERPKSNLVEKVVGRDLKDLGSIMKGFLGGTKSDRPKKKKGERSREQSPAESPPPSLPDESASPSPPEPTLTP